MAAGTYAARLDELERTVGHGRLVGAVEVDQVYAKYQHEGLDLKHPDGGSAKYLERPLMDGHQDALTRLAKRATEPDGLHEAMRENVEGLSRQVYEHAPFEFGDLRASGHPTVTDDERTVYDRPPLVHRLTDDELRAKGHLRSLGFGSR